MKSGPSLFLPSSHICHKVSSCQPFLPRDLCTCFSSHPLHLWLIFQVSAYAASASKGPSLFPIYPFSAGFLFITPFNLPLFHLLPFLLERKLHEGEAPVSRCWWMDEWKEGRKERRKEGRREGGSKELPSDLHRCQPRAWCCSCLSCRDSSWLYKDRQTQS